MGQIVNVLFYLWLKFHWKKEKRCCYIHRKQHWNRTRENPKSLQTVISVFSTLYESQATSEPTYEVWYMRPKLKFLFGVLPLMASNFNASPLILMRLIPLHSRKSCILAGLRESSVLKCDDWACLSTEVFQNRWVLHLTDACLTRCSQSSKLCSFLGSSTLTPAPGNSFCCLWSTTLLQTGFLFSLLPLSMTLKLCAVAEGIWQDDIFIEVIRTSVTVTLDLINNLMDGDDWRLFSTSMGQFWQRLVHGSAVCKKCYKRLLVCSDRAKATVQREKKILCLWQVTE